MPSRMVISNQNNGIDNQNQTPSEVTIDTSPAKRMKDSAPGSPCSGGD